MPLRPHPYALLIALAALLPAAAEAASASRFVLQAPIALKRPEAVPDGFESDALLPPLLNLGFSWQEIPEEPKRPGFRLDLNASFPRYSLIPVLGVAPSIDFDLGQVTLSVGADIQNQLLLSKAPFGGSQFDTLIGSVGPRLDWEISPIVTFSLGGRFIFITQTRLASFEGLDTEIDHQGSFSISPSLRFRLPEGIEAMAQADIYSLGATGIASKEFAFGIPSQNGVVRWSVGVSKGFGNFGIEAYYALVTGVRDPLELAYQAPFLTRDYLLSPQTLTLGVSWKP